MEGYIFKEKRETIEVLFEMIQKYLDDEKDVKKASEELKRTEELISQLSDEVDESEIQKRSIKNMEIWCRHLANKISKSSVH
jgi:hypothetical protein